MFMNLADYNILQDTVQTKEIQAVLDEATRKGEVWSWSRQGLI